MLPTSNDLGEAKACLDTRQWLALTADTPTGELYNPQKGAYSLTSLYTDARNRVMIGSSHESHNLNIYFHKGPPPLAQRPFNLATSDTILPGCLRIGLMLASRHAV